MYPRRMTAGVGIVCHPGIAFDMRLKHEYVPVSRSNHSRSRRGSGKAKPVRCEVQFRHDPAEDPQRGSATTERSRAAGRPTANQLGACDIGLWHVRPTVRRAISSVLRIVAACVRQTDLVAMKRNRKAS